MSSSRKIGLLSSPEGTPPRNTGIHQKVKECKDAGGWQKFQLEAVQHVPTCKLVGGTYSACLPHQISTKYALKIFYAPRQANMCRLGVLWKRTAIQLKDVDSAVRNVLCRHLRLFVYGAAVVEHIHYPVAHVNPRNGDGTAHLLSSLQTAQKR